MPICSSSASSPAPTAGTAQPPSSSSKLPGLLWKRGIYFLVETGKEQEEEQEEEEEEEEEVGVFILIHLSVAFKEWDKRWEDIEKVEGKEYKEEEEEEEEEDDWALFLEEEEEEEDDDDDDDEEDGGPSVI